MSRLGAIVPLLCLLATPMAETSELQYVSNLELQQEIRERARDIARTEERIAEISASEVGMKKALADARAANKRVESMAMLRARVYYQFTQRGNGLRYLLSADSAVEMLRRAVFLQQLLKEGLEARREAGLRIAASKKQLEAVREEKAAALEMHTMLTQTFAELQAEMKQRRSGRRH